MIVMQEAYDQTEPTIDSHIVKLKSSGADVLYDVSTPKFAAQAIKKMVQIGWMPMHILSNPAASIGATLRPAGFENSQGIISATYGMDPSDPQWKDNPSMKAWFEFMDKWVPNGDRKDAGYAYGYNLARTLVQVLMQCGDDLTRENVMRQAANLKEFEPGTSLPGVKINTTPTDFYPIEQLQLMRFEGEGWKLFGPVMSGKLPQ